MEPWVTKRGWIEERLCAVCCAKRFSPRFSRKNKDSFCIICGKVLEKFEAKARNGGTYLTSGQRKYCPECNPHDQKRKHRNCIVCGEPLERANKYCPTCKPKKRHNPNPKLHSLHARNWQKNNKEKVECSRLARLNSHKVLIIYECPHNGNGKKHWHHHDYTKPYEVLALCHKCHRAEHKRLRALARIDETQPINAQL